MMNKACQTRKKVKEQEKMNKFLSEKQEIIKEESESPTLDSSDLEGFRRNIEKVIDYVEKFINFINPIVILVSL